ncbi:hypothetical protein F5H01DRAFT_316380 [Linnemannia elongata]|nr:hypothetical protein F5H01DRAFT_316380 [Linnemannia elongata]
MPSLFLSKIFANKYNNNNNNNNNITITPTPTPASTTSQQIALSIPEILKHILSFLTRKNRQDSARLVCKEWHAICKNLLPTSYTWILRINSKINTNTTDRNDSDDEQKIRDLVSLANNIIIQIDSDNRTAAASQQRLVSWKNMMSVLSSITRERTNRGAPPRLQTLHLRETALTNFTVQLPLLPRLTTLSTLRIDSLARWDIVHLFTIVRACPDLEELSIKPTPGAARASPSSLQDERLELTSAQERNLISGSNTLPKLTRLQTCCLYNLTLTLPALRAFLEASPRLSKLVLAHCNHLVREGQRDARLLSRTHYHDEQDARIIRLVGEHCPDLKIFHLSLPYGGGSHGLGTPEIAVMLETFPHMEEYNLSEVEFDPVIFKSPDTAGYTNRITTMNLLPTRPDAYRSEGAPLREILCSFEHLVHLRAPASNYYIEDMDLHNVLEQLEECNLDESPGCGKPQPFIPKNDSAVARQYIWACRGLKTLHMKIEQRWPTYRFQTERWLIVFGFLSRMAPRLQELHLSRYTTDVSFRGGSCLTRLQDLERIRIVINFCPWTDFNFSTLSWLDPTPPSTRDRFVYWCHRREKERRDIWKHYKSIAPSGVSTAGSMMVERGREMGMDLRKLGYPDDLLEWMDERYRDPTTDIGTIATNTTTPGRRKEPPSPLPKLQSFWVEMPHYSDIDYEQLRDHEEFVARVRPEVDIQLRRPYQDEYYLMTLKMY